MAFPRTLRVSSLLLMASLAGCSVTATTGGPTCALDPSVGGCASNASGYSCTGSDTPDESNADLFCSSGVDNGDAVLYCCVDVVFTASTCGADSTVQGCDPPSIGFSCANGASPEATDSSLQCSAGVQGTGGSLIYCCNTAGSAPVVTMAACVSDSEIPCSGSSVGILCTGGIRPDATLNCSGGTTEPDQSTGYCCATAPTTTTTSTCAADGAVVGCTGGSVGYSCTGLDTPEASDATLLCSDGTAATGATDYCCLTGTATNSCVEDPTIQGCPGSSYGFKCTGTDTPPGTNASLVCGTGTADGTAMDYCCVAN